MKENNKEQERLILLSSNVLMKQHPLPIFFGNMLLGIIIPLLYHLIRFSFLIVIIGRKI